MSNMDIFSKYAEAFEETLLDDQWQRLEPFFREDASYAPGDGSVAKGRDAAIQALRDSVNQLEKKVDSRTLLEVPTMSEEGDVIKMYFQLRYTKSGRPDYALKGVETVRYVDGLIATLEDELEDPDGYQAWIASL